MKQSELFWKMPRIAPNLPNEQPTSLPTIATGAWKPRGAHWRKSKIGWTARKRPSALPPMAMHEKRRPCKAAPHQHGRIWEQPPGWTGEDNSALAYARLSTSFPIPRSVLGGAVALPLIARRHTNSRKFTPSCLIC
jgi:hypothetical protein